MHRAPAALRSFRNCPELTADDSVLDTPCTSAALAPGLVPISTCACEPCAACSCSRLHSASFHDIDDHGTSS